jgi:hypothetical protein
MRLSNFLYIPDNFLHFLQAFYHSKQKKGGAKQYAKDMGATIS